MPEWLDEMKDYTDIHDQLAATLTGADHQWLDQLRRTAMTRFGETGFPTVRDEDWKYTDVRQIARGPFVPSLARDKVAAVTEGSFSPLTGEGSVVLVFSDGAFKPELSNASNANGVTVQSLSDQLATRPETVRGRFSSLVPEENRGFISLNHAFAEDGAYIHVDGGASGESVIELVFLYGANGADQAVQPHNLISLEPDSRVVLVERHLTVTPGRQFVNGVSEVFLGADSNLSHILIQETGPDVFQIHGNYVDQSRGSCYRCWTVTLGGRLVRNNVIVRQKATECESDLRGLYLGRGRQHVDNHTTLVHEKEHGTSRENYKGVLDDRARAVFHGRIVVQPGAQKTDSAQNNSTLILSRDAEIDTKPQLEIYADDVKCAHGATVGQLDESSLFYLRSRGIDEVNARAMLTFAFASEVLEGMPLSAAHDHIEAGIAEAMHLPAPAQQSDDLTDSTND